MDPTLKAFLIAVLLLMVGSALTFMATRYWNLRAAKLLAATDALKEIEAVRKATQERLDEIERQLGSIAQTVQPISVAFQAILIKQLTHEHSPVLDDLMAKIGPPNILTDEEQVELLFELKERAKDMSSLISDSERDAAKMLPLVMDRVKAETEAPPPPQDVVLVAVPPGIGTPVSLPPVAAKKKEEEEAKEK